MKWNDENLETCNIVEKCKSQRNKKPNSAGLFDRRKKTPNQIQKNRFFLSMDFRFFPASHECGTVCNLNC